MCVHLDSLDSNANDGRCREPWKLIACISHIQMYLISIQITIFRDSSIICRRGCCYSFETMSHKIQMPFTMFLLAIEIVFETFMLLCETHAQCVDLFFIRKVSSHFKKMNESWNCSTRAVNIFNSLRLHHLAPTTSTMWTPHCFITSLCARTCVGWIRELFYILTQ